MKNFNIEAIVLSADSLLYDLNSYKQDIYSSVIRAHNLEVHPTFFELLLDGGYQQVERAYIHYNQYRMIRDEMEKAYDTKLLEALNNNNLDIVFDSLSFLNWISTLDLKIGLIASSNREITLKLLDNYPLSFSYDAIVCGNEVLEAKPEKDIYTKVSKKLKVNPQNIVAIDSTLNGVMGAYLANMMSIYVEIFKLRVEKVQKYSHFQCPNLKRIQTLF